MATMDGEKNIVKHERIIIKVVHEELLVPDMITVKVVKEIILVPESIRFKVVNEEGKELYFLMKRESTFKKMKMRYCKEVGLDLNKFKFQFDGHRLRDDDTPLDIDMRNNDIIEVVPKRRNIC